LRVERALELAASVPGGADPDAPWLELGDTIVRSFADLVDLLDGNALDGMMAGPVAPGTLDAFRRRLHAAAQHVGHLVRGDDAARGRAIDWRARQVTVVDIHNLHSTGQMFVVGVLLKRMMEQKELQGTSRPLVF